MKKKVFHRADRIKKKESRELMYSTGMFIQYSTMSREEAVSFINAGNLIFSGSEAKTLQDIGYVMECKDEACRNFKKVNKKGKAYQNIYAHRLLIAVPSYISEDYSAHDLIASFLFTLDWRTKNMPWAARKLGKGKHRYIDLIIFSQAVLSKPVSETVRYPGDYYWNPETKRRAKAGSPNAVLLHKKGEAKKDKDGKEIKRVRYCAYRDSGLFRYVKKNDHVGISGFEVMMERIKGAFLDAVSRMVFKPILNARVRIRYAAKKDSYRQSTTLKVRAKNAVIRAINDRIARLYDGLILGSLIETEEIRKKWEWLLRSLKHLCHGKSFKYHNINVVMNYRGYYETFIERTELMRRKADELFKEYTDFVARILYDYGLIDSNALEAELA